MAKITLDNLVNLNNPTSAVTTINNNNDLIEQALENTLSRDGTSPNAMNAVLDMNGFRILNLPNAVSITEPVRLGEVQELIQSLIDDKDGDNGWTPILAIVPDGERRVLQIAEWTGGTGLAPTSAGSYLGTTGLTTDISAAVNIRGPQGASGSGTGDMLEATYDPNNISADVFDSENIVFDPTGTDLDAVNVSDAIKELDDKILTSGDSIPLGTIVDFAGPFPPTKWLYCAGQAISRSTYSSLFTAVTGSVSVTSTSGSATLTAVGTDLRGIGLIGAAIEGTGIASGTTITDITIDTIVLSASATASGTVTATIIPWGNGDGSTTFNLPDLRGRTTFGRDNMTNSSANNITAAGSGIQGTLLGRYGGSQNHTLTLTETPSHNHGGTVGNSGKHTHTYQAPVATIFQLGGGSGFFYFSPTTSSTSETPDHTHTITAAGGGQAHPNVQPSGIVNKIIKVST